MHGRARRVATCSCYNFLFTLKTIPAQGEECLARLPQRVPVSATKPAARPVPGRRIGIHTSVAGGVSKAAERAYHRGCNTLQIFSTSPRQWKPSSIDAAEARLFLKLREKYDLRPLAIHDNYLINLASADPVIREKSIEAFRGELERAVLLEAEYLIAHPGSAGGGDRREALVRFIVGMEHAARGLSLGRLRILIENTAGGGGALGCDHQFEEVRAILRLADRIPLGCCLDTAHLYQCGMDVSQAAGLDAVVERFERAVGLDCLHVIHTNDSKTALGSRADRHQHIGEGRIGLEGFRRILNHAKLRDKAFILETPIDKEGDDLRNLNTVRGLVAPEGGRRRAAATERRAVQPHPGRAPHRTASRNRNGREIVQPAGNRA